MAKRAKLNPRKLLIASVGVATLDYTIACGNKKDETSTVANLVAPSGGSAGAEMSSGGSTVANLVAPGSGGVAEAGPAGSGGDLGSGGSTVANLIAPAPGEAESE